MFILSHRYSVVLVVVSVVEVVELVVVVSGATVVVELVLMLDVELVDVLEVEIVVLVDVDTTGSDSPIGGVSDAIFSHTFLRRWPPPN
jgi:hypothetical protein